MNTNKLKLYLGIICLTFLLPTTSQAYFTTSQSATKLTSDTVLFTVSYKFGFADRELYMPIGAQRDVDTKSDSHYAGYQILIDGIHTELGHTSSLALTSSDAVQIKDNQYYLPPGTSAEFTLVTLLTIPKDKVEKRDVFSLIVSHLPFTMVDEGNPIPAHLNPSELKYYQTPEVSFE